MSSILSKPVNPLIPLRRATMPDSHVEERQSLPSIPRSEPEPIRSPQERFSGQVEPWPFPTKVNASEVPQNASTVPPLTPIKVESGVPTLERISRTPTPPPAPLVPPAPPEVKELSFPTLIPIGDATEIATVGVALPEGFTPPPLVSIRKDNVGVPEIPALAIRARDVHTYMIFGVDGDGELTDIYSSYLPDQLDRLPGSNLVAKLQALFIQEFRDMKENDMVTRRLAGTRYHRSVTPENASATGLVTSLEIIDASDGESQAYVCYTFKAIKFKMNTSGIRLKFNLVP